MNGPSGEQPCIYDNVRIMHNSYLLCTVATTNPFLALNEAETRKKAKYAHLVASQHFVP